MAVTEYFRKNKFTLSSLGLVVSGIATLIYHNYQLALLYKAAQGKSRALFVLQEYAVLDRKVLVLILLLGGLMGLYLGFREKIESRYLGIFVLGLHGLAIYLTFLRFWIWMV
jgi:hypothetical protein